MSERQQTKCLGLLGGLGVGAAVHYYQRLAELTSERKTILRFVMSHADMDEVQVYLRAGNMAGLASYFNGFLEQAARAGATVGALPSVTSHACIQELKPISPVPMINLLEVVSAELKRQNVRRAALFGTRYVMGSSLFGAAPEVEWVQPTAEEFDTIDREYFAMAYAGRGTSEQHETLTRIAHRLCRAEGAEIILLAGTDLTLVFNPSNTDFPHIDCAEVHIQAILQAIL